VKMEKQLVINVDRCTGCRMCEMACSLEKEGECNTRYSRIKVIKMDEGLDIPLVCLQCEDPVCENVCPVKAITRDSNGALVINYDLCIGCKLCLALCPLGATSIDPWLKRIIKCDLCNGDPTCVKFCQPKAIEYVRKDRADTTKRRITAKRIFESIKSEEKLKVAGSKIR